MRRTKLKKKTTTKTKKKQTSPKKKNRVARSDFDGRKEKRFSNNANVRLDNYVGLSYKVARSIESKVLSFEERQQAALIGIARGLESFQSGAIPELAWLSIKAKYAVEDAIRSEKRRRNKTQLVDSEQIDDLSLLNFGVFSENLENFSENKEKNRIRRIVRNALNSLDERTREIVILIEFKKVRQIEIARRFNISQGWCSRLYRRGLRSLQEYISERLTIIS